MHDMDWAAEQRTLESATESLQSVRRATVGTWQVLVTLRPGGFRAEARAISGGQEQWFGVERPTLGAATADAVEWVTAHTATEVGSHDGGPTLLVPGPPEESSAAEQRVGGGDLWVLVAVWVLGVPVILGVVGWIGLGVGFAQDAGQHHAGQGEVVAVFIGGFALLGLMSWAILSPAAKESDAPRTPPSSSPAMGDLQKTEHEQRGRHAPTC